ncbi:MAG: hypothetical protein NWS20_01655 [Rickettsiaceae bacterium]|nr:hypothetical protein [Rickettsiaceae bacterium]MDP5021188.1 hypothetical protein [Rickettsiaceae bacterium]MDP5083751.1 hypothetical protein [Rickettsiaceae bacterium]
MYGVIKFQAPFERLKEYDYSPEVRLYKAILTQAIIDASNIVEAKDAKKLKLEAKRWIFGNSKYFQEVCYNAKIEPGFVIRIAKEAIKLNCTKRIDIKSEPNIREGKFHLDIKRKYIA